MKTLTDRVTFGFWVYLMSDCVLFASLFATYAVLRGETFGGATPAALFSLPYVFTETLILLTSSFTCGMAVLAAQAHKKNLTLWALGATLLLGLSFVGMEFSEFARMLADGHGWQTSAFLSAFFTLVGTHGLHVALGALWLLVISAHILWRGLHEGTTRKLFIFSLFWHFLDLIWIFIFTFVYLFGFL